MINLLRKEEESWWNMKKFLYLLNPGQVPPGTLRRFNFVLVALATGVSLFCQLASLRRGRTQNLEGCRVKRFFTFWNRDSPHESNATKLSSFGFPVKAFLFVSKTTYNYPLTVSGFMVKISDRPTGGGAVTFPTLQDLVASGFSLSTETQTDQLNDGRFWFLTDAM